MAKDRRTIFHRAAVASDGQQKRSVTVFGWETQGSDPCIDSQRYFAVANEPLGHGWFSGNNPSLTKGSIERCIDGQYACLHRLERRTRCHPACLIWKSS